MPTGNVVITEHQQELIDSLIESRRYQNATEVLREGLRLVEQRDAAETEKLRLLREAVHAGFDDVAAGRYIAITSEADETAFWAGVGLSSRPRSMTSRPTRTRPAAPYDQSWATASAPGICASAAIGRPPNGSASRDTS